MGQPNRTRIGAVDWWLKWFINKCLYRVAVPTELYCHSTMAPCGLFTYSILKLTGSRTMYNAAITTWFSVVRFSSLSNSKNQLKLPYSFWCLGDRVWGFFFTSVFVAVEICEFVGTSDHFPQKKLMLRCGFNALGKSLPRFSSPLPLQNLSRFYTGPTAVSEDLLLPGSKRSGTIVTWSRMWRGFSSTGTINSVHSSWILFYP